MCDLGGIFLHAKRPYCPFAGWSGSVMDRMRTRELTWQPGDIVDGEGASQARVDDGTESWNRGEVMNWIDGGHCGGFRPDIASL